MSAKVDDPEANRVQMVEQLRKSKKQELISKKRQALMADQLLEGDVHYFEQEYNELSCQNEDLGLGGFLQQSAQTADQYIDNT